MLDTLDKILELLENKDFPQLGNLLKDMNPADVAELFEDLPREKMALVFRLLPKEPRRPSSRWSRIRRSC